MARLKKTQNVAKFGGTDDLGTVQIQNVDGAPVKDVNYEVKSIETQSKTKLEDDKGFGNAAIIRCFKFGLNLESFKQHQPTRQELFNSHIKGIEVALWKDGMKVMTDVTPRIVINEQDMQYQIFVGAQPMKGQLLSQTPHTLRELVNDDVAHG